MNVLFGVDFISMSLIVLTNLFIYLCVLSLREADIYGKYKFNEILILLYFIQ
jgi:NADH:ubiquinone oxidoreductase subunit 4 (subunit M)